MRHVVNILCVADAVMAIQDGVVDIVVGASIAFIANRRTVRPRAIAVHLLPNMLT